MGVLHIHYFKSFGNKEKYRKKENSLEATLEVITTNIQCLSS